MVHACLRFLFCLDELCLFRDRPPVVQPGSRLALQLKLTLNFSSSPELGLQTWSTVPDLVSARQQIEDVVHASKHCM